MWKAPLLLLLMVKATTSSNYGNYILKGINQLGKVTITASHPQFSKAETKEIEFKMGSGLNPCDEGNLTFNGVNFVLKDQDVFFTVTVKDKLGNVIPAHVLASNADWRFEQDVNSEQTPMPGMQPGKYFFTITAPGFKTLGQDVNAVPNNQHLEFVLEPLFGRLTDGGLTTHAPQLLWEFDRDKNVIIETTATKDGKIVIIYNVNMTDTNYNSSGKLWFIDSLSGNLIKVVNTVNAGTHESNSCLDTSYDGNTTALYLKKHGNFNKANNFLKLFDSTGRQFVHEEINPHSAGDCDVSPDGFYVYPFRLMNKGMYTYTRFDIKGVESSEQPMTYLGQLHFTTANTIVANCYKGDGQCLQTLNQTTITSLGEIQGDARMIDSSQDVSSVAMMTVHKAYLFRNGTKSWEKEVITRGDPLSISVSPGGKYVIYSTNLEDIHGRIFKIFTDNNLDKTVGGIQRNEDVLFVHANDKGLFYLAQDGKTIRYYKVGSYSVDYNPATPSPDTSGQEKTYNISYYENGVWFGLGETSFYQLMPGRIYMANQTTSLELMEPIGTLKFLEGTLFGVDNYRNPVLLKGQITADFNSPVKLFAIKFDRFDMNLFAQKLAAFTADTLDESEYFRVSNIHTKFKVSNYENKFNVAVESGEVKVFGENIEEKVESGKQITIDKDNKISETVYLGWKIWVIIGAVIILVFPTLLYKYKNTKVGKKLIQILKYFGKTIFKYVKILILFIWKYLLKALILLYQGTKILIIKIIKKIKTKK